MSDKCNKSGYTQPMISVSNGQIGLFDGPEIVREFRPFTNESEALQEAHAWFKTRTIHVPQVVRPMIRKMTCSAR